MDQSSLYNKKIIFLAYVTTYAQYVSSHTEGTSDDEDKKNMKNQLVPFVNMIGFDGDKNLQKNAVDEICDLMVEVITLRKKAYKENPLDPIEFASVSVINSFPDTSEEELVEMIKFTHETLNGWSRYNN